MPYFPGVYFLFRVDALFLIFFYEVILLRDELELLLKLGDSEEVDPSIDLSSIFSNDSPVELEIGIGKGRFLIDSAARCPSINFIGVEWAMKYLRIAHDRSLRKGQHNVRFVRADAREFVEFFLKTNSISTYHIYFPDPWPKKRHHKRRLIDSDFVIEIERTLCSGGMLRLATDHKEYFSVMVDVFGTSTILEPVDAEWDGVRTNYEEKYMAQGKSIYRRIYRHL